MTLQSGDSIPELTLTLVDEAGPKPVASKDFFAGKTVVLFAVPGAFTPTCSARHLPGFKDHVADFAAKGVDVVACTSVNDYFVMKAWAKDQGINDEKPNQAQFCTHSILGISPLCLHLWISYHV